MWFLNKSNQKHRSVLDFTHNENQDKSETSSDSSRMVYKVYSPTAGQVVPLQQVNDEIFMKGMLGKGIGILPEIPIIYSPVSGTVKYIPETKHALMISADDGVDVLIHVGIDTVNLKGQFFKMITHINDHIAVGDLLLHFDIKEISDLGYNLVIPVVITNSNDYSRVEPTNAERVNATECLIDVFK